MWHAAAKRGTSSSAALGRSAPASRTSRPPASHVLKVMAGGQAGWVKDDLRGVERRQTATAQLPGQACCG